MKEEKKSIMEVFLCVFLFFGFAVHPNSYDNFGCTAQTQRVGKPRKCEPTHMTTKKEKKKKKKNTADRKDQLGERTDQAEAQAV